MTQKKFLFRSKILMIQKIGKYIYIYIYIFMYIYM